MDWSHRYHCYRHYNSIGAENNVTFGCSSEWLYLSMQAALGCWLWCRSKAVQQHVHTSSLRCNPRPWENHPAVALTHGRCRREELFRIHTPSPGQPGGSSWVCFDPFASRGWSAAAKYPWRSSNPYGCPAQPQWCGEDPDWAWSLQPRPGDLTPSITSGVGQTYWDEGLFSQKGELDCTEDLQKSGQKQTN